ncbi:MAG: copper-binding protein, partial [Candidatus Competibacteraceae bacterium]|nr:copper-binding protein [Candidatus Competibacteraceae bacterium]
APPKPEIWTEGVINTVERETRTLNVTHEPIPELKWPTMTMDFPVAKGVKLDGLQSESRMRFRISEGEDGRYQIDAVDSARAQP